MRTLKMNPETFWWIRPNSSAAAFNEDADDKPAQITTTLSSTLDTRGIDQYRQGVEITTWRHWTQGTVKIHAGEPGHMVQPENYGLRDLALSGRTFTDRSVANPVLFISSSTTIVHRTTYLAPSVPPVLFTRGDAERHLCDGALDSLDVRNVALCFGGDVPIQGPGVRGAVMAGTLDSAIRADIVTSFIHPINSSSAPAFNDIGGLYDLRWPNARHNLPVSALAPFTDRRIYLGEEESPTDAQIAAIVNRATGSGDFLPSGCRASTSGWVYDDGVGTDSIAFGGLTY